MRKRFVAAAALLFSGAPLPVMAACGDDPNACRVEMGEYHIALPSEAENAPAVLFIHGFGSSGKGPIGNRAISGPITERGYALIAPNGEPRSEGGRTSWSFHPEFPPRRDELAFFKQVVADAADKFGIDPDRVLLSGFSIGGSMTSYVACETPEAFAAYAPVSGGVWRPHPEKCAGPVRLFHTHGWRDGTVPLEGRPLRGGALMQGDVFHAMLLWREANGCTQMKADSFEMTEDFWRRKWTRCEPGSALEFALFDGGHTVPDGWADVALDWFEALDPPIID